MENRKWHRSMLKTNAKANLKKYYWWAVLVCLVISFVTGFSGVFNFGRLNTARINSSYVYSSENLTPYELGYVEGYNRGFNTCRNGFPYSEDDVKTNSDTNEYSNGLLDGYHTGYYDCFNGNEFDSDPPSIKEAKKGFSYNESLSFKENVAALARSMGMSENKFYAALIVAGIITVIIWLFSIIFSLFVAQPLTIGGLRFFMCARSGDVQFSNIGYAFKKGQYMKTVKTGFIKNLYIFFWSLLFVVPGIVKSFSYALVPYILSENPTISARKAISISKKTMKGEKWHLFILSISFILWYILGAVACCGIGMVFIQPYLMATYAEFYALMRQKALAFGYATEEELPGYPDGSLNNNIPPYNSGMSFGNPVPNSNVNNDFSNSDNNFSDSSNTDNEH